MSKFDYDEDASEGIVVIKDGKEIPLSRVQSEQSKEK